MIKSVRMIVLEPCCQGSFDDDALSQQDRHILLLSGENFKQVRNLAEQSKNKVLKLQQVSCKQEHSYNSSTNCPQTD